MRLDMSQQMKMDQRMVLAPRMIQSMEILQLPLLALQERIEQEMLTNPVLELEEPDITVSETNTDQTTAEANQEFTESEQLLSIREDKDKQADFERLNSIGDDYDDYMSRSSYIPSRRVSGDEPDRKMEAMQNTTAPSQSLNENLKAQWVFIEASPIVKTIGDVIIDYIDEAGYLSVTLESLTERVREEITRNQLEEALHLVQGLEPSGVGARNLAECLLIQLRNSNEDRMLEIELITNHLKDIEMNRFPAIAKKTQLSLTDIKEAMKNIAHLDPRPGLQVGDHNIPYILPDIIVTYNETLDQYVAHLSDGSSPNLRINPFYSTMMKQGKITTDAKEFLQNNVRSARWIIESIEQRKITLLRVVKHVLENQRDFFDHGPLHLKPLPMVEVADVLGIHVGTVSRAVSGKYMQTPIGIFPLRYFFSGGTETANGESVSWDAVKAKLQEIIDNEDKKKPYNDDELVVQLKEHGITLARRTVAKYRSTLNIPPARRRKEFD